MFYVLSMIESKYRAGSLCFCRIMRQLRDVNEAAVQEIGLTGEEFQVRMLLWPCVRIAQWTTFTQSAPLIFAV